MLDFKSEIILRITQIEDDIENIRIEVYKRWGEYLFASNINTSQELTKFQIAFLSFLTEKYDAKIYPNIKPIILKYFYDWYEKINDDIIISFQGLNVKNIEDGTWEILYEDETNDPIVHVLFVGWKVDYFSLTG